MAGMTSGALMAMCAAPAKIASVPGMPKYVRSSSFSVCFSMRPLAAFASVQQEVMDEEDDLGIVCDPCGGKGWILCDFCNGQKTNVKSKSNRIYRRCPSCKAVGCILCEKCKVFKCVTFPNYDDGEDINL
ncbi:unnamed protein product [Rhodiola kirilowii]